MRSFTADRRLFLKALLFATGALAATGAGMRRARALAGKRVIVVGAGVAGLSAARALKNQGAEVVVLEAKPRIGGRLFTDFTLGPPFEVGAGWIHGPTPDNPVVALAEAVGAKTLVTDDGNLVIFNADGEALPDEEVAEIDEKMTGLAEKLDEALETNDTRSVRAAIEAIAPGALKDPDIAWAVSAFWEFSKGAPIEDLSALYFLADKAFPAADVVVTTGYDKILGPVADGLDIRLSKPVSNIAYGDDGVEVTAAGETFEGDYVVCSAPLGILKAGKITFAPALPGAYAQNIAKLGFGSVTKIAFEFTEPFWDTEVQYFGIETERKGRWNYWLNYRTFAPQNIILGLSVGDYAPVADRMSDEEMKADSLDVLRGVWGDEVGEPARMLATHWSTDPETLGAYAYPTPGSRPNQFDDLADPVAGRLFLCGEHTIFDYAGTVHGAWMTGLRAAELVAEEAE